MKRLCRAVILTALVCAGLLLTSEPLGAQCAMCRTALTESAEGQQMARGLNQAIVFLLGAPYLVFGTLAASLWVRGRRNRARERFF